MSHIEEAIKKLGDGINLLSAEMEDVMREIMGGKLETPQIVSFLSRLNEKAETSEEVIGAVKVMRENMIKVVTRHKVVLDTCGTGGDRKHTFNISTAASFVAAGAGVAVAKHGNRSVSSKVGSADVLEALGVNINMSRERAQECLDEIGITFLFAPNFHPAMKYVIPARKQIAAKTIFNFLGPLCNPAGAGYQLIGVYDNAWALNLALALKDLGAIHALVVHGQDKMDEVSTHAKTLVYEVYKGKLVEKNGVEIDLTDYADLGFKKSGAEDLKGQDDPLENAAIITNILSKKKGDLTAKELYCREALVLNTAAALYAASETPSPLKEGIKEKISLAEDSIDSTKALEKLKLLKEYSKK